MLREPLVMLPPMLCDARVFAPQIEALSREMAVMVAPVHKAERVEEIASSLLDVLPQRFALCGAGFGGIVAQELLRRAEKRITRVALIATSTLPDTPQEASDREPRMIAAKMGRLDEVIAEELPATAFAEGSDTSRLMALLRQMGRDLGAEAYIRQAKAMQRRKDQQGMLRKLELPVRLISGRHDPFVPVRRKEFVAELIGQAEMSVIETAGHLPTLEAPEEVIAILREWMGAPLVLR